LCPISFIHSQDFVTRLFTRACDDYLSVPLWLRRCDWAYEVLLERHENPSRSQYESVRALYESAINSCGLHFKQGQEVWLAFIAFEKKLLSVESSSSTSNNNNANLSAEEKKREETEQQQQLTRIRNLYKRMLSVPLEKLESLFADYEKWESEISSSGASKPNNNNNNNNNNSKPPQCAFLPQYKSALIKAQSLATFEAEISDSYDGDSDVDYGQFPAWTAYIRAEQSELEKGGGKGGKGGGGGSAARVRCLYERALKNYFLVIDLWRDYLSFLERVNAGLANISAVFPVLERALRNCPCASLWTRYMALQEQSEALVLEIGAVFKRALAGETTGACDWS
jgi:hypothetical protein